MFATSVPLKSIKSPITALPALGVVLLVAACGSNGASSPASSSAPAGGTSSASAPAPSGGATSSAPGPVGVEVHPPGDIPDNQAFVPFAGTGFTVTTPEGWGRSHTGSSVVFSDKYNSITIAMTARAQAPTTASARSSDLPAIKAATKGFVPGTISSVGRKSGRALLITYRAYSPVNAVTGKVALEAVERYTFWRAGKAVTLTLAAPVGSDNVDPWRTVTDSFVWTK